MTYLDKNIQNLKDITNELNQKIEKVFKNQIEILKIISESQSIGICFNYSDGEIIYANKALFDFFRTEINKLKDKSEFNTKKLMKKMKISEEDYNKLESACFNLIKNKENIDLYEEKIGFTLVVDGKKRPFVAIQKKILYMGKEAIISFIIDVLNIIEAMNLNLKEFKL